MLKNNEKLLHNIAAKYIVGENINVELEGSAAEIECLFELLEVSKLLKTALNDKKTSLEEIQVILESKKSTTKMFINLTGINWSL